MKRRKNWFLRLKKYLTAKAKIKKKYDRLENALEEVEATGYGIVMPDID